MKYQDKEISFDFEKQFCLDNLQVWKDEAHNLFYSAEVLHHFDQIKTVHVFDPNESFSAMFPPSLTDRAYFNYRTQRMLWAYGFENLLKLIILANYKINHPDTTNIPFNKIKSHSLHSLAKKADIKLSEPETFYCGILEKCSIWAGRYPLPIRKEQMYEQRKPLSNKDALQERANALWEKFLKKEIPRTISEEDVLYSGINNIEYKIYHSLKLRLIDQSNRLLNNEK